MAKFLYMTEHRWVCVAVGCSNDARYVPADDPRPRYCGVHDILFNNGKGERIEPAEAARLIVNETEKAP